jgi:acetyl-CoA carboxylase biotin carboxylase subunit
VTFNLPGRGDEFFLHVPDAAGFELRCYSNQALFSPCPGKVTQYHAPGGLGVRIDSALYDGYRIPPYYDSLIGKLIVHGRDRPEALARLKRALGELIIDGVDTSIPLFHLLLAEPEIQNGDYNIHWLEKWLEAKFS